jgi:CheY-like chemotaxis protein
VGKGIGMGLPVALGVAKRHGGTITAQSRIDKGSVFTVYLPAMAEDARLAPDPVQEPRLDRKASILLVDDEEAILSSMRRALERSGYSVTCAAGGREAFDLFSRAPDAFDLVITDLSMPGMDGQELTRRLLRIRPGTRVILSTGYGDVVTEEEAHALGIGEILLKPPDTGELNAAVERALKG